MPKKELNLDLEVIWAITEFYLQRMKGGDTYLYDWLWYKLRYGIRDEAQGNRQAVDNYVEGRLHEVYEKVKMLRKSAHNGYKAEIVARVSPMDTDVPTFRSKKIGGK
jgi:hypothetical protein